MDYRCSKSYIIGKNDILQNKYDNKLNALLGKCQNLFHNNNPFCGWCEEYKKIYVSYVFQKNYKKNINIYYL